MVTLEMSSLCRNASYDCGAHCKAEAQVRSIVLNLCSIVLNHVMCPPALINAVIAIMLH